MVTPLFAVLFGFVLGIKHSLEPDHVVTISSIVSEQKNTVKAALVGLWWGLGHTTTLFFLGLIILVARVNISEKVGLFFELCVGIILILLGIRMLWKKSLKKQNFTNLSTRFHTHHRSFFIGTIHGIAGTGALMLLVLTTIPSIPLGIVYIVLFGTGSIVGMTITSIVLSIPFALSQKKLPGTDKYLKIITGIISILFGLFISYEIIFVESLFF